MPRSISALTVHSCFPLFPSLFLLPSFSLPSLLISQRYWGGMGFTNEVLVSRFHRDLRLMSIGGGADEVISN